MRAWKRKKSKSVSSVDRQWRNKVEAVSAGRVCSLCAGERELKDDRGTVRRGILGNSAIAWRP